MKFKFLFVTLILSLTLSSTFAEVIAITDSTGKATDKVQQTDSLLRTIDLLHDKANEIENLSEKGFNLEEIKSGLPQITSDIRTLKTSLKANARVMDMKSLQTFAALLAKSHGQLKEWRTVLLGYNQQLVNMQAEIQELHQSIRNIRENQ